MILKHGMAWIAGIPLCITLDAVKIRRVVNVLYGVLG